MVYARTFQKGNCHFHRTRESVIGPEVEEVPICATDALSICSAVVLPTVGRGRIVKRTAVACQADAHTVE